MMLAWRSETNENQVLFWKRDLIITERENKATMAFALSLIPLLSLSRCLSLPVFPVVSLHCLSESLTLATIMAYRSQRKLSMRT